MKKGVIVFILVLVAGIVVIQFIPGAPRDNPPPETPVVFPPDVETVMRGACMDCHSNETRWPWYSKIAPFSWYLSRDVQEARSRLNFSTWGTLTPETRLELLTALWDQVVERRMPHKAYVLMHPNVGLTVADKKIIRDWTFGQVEELVRETNQDSTD